MIGPNVPKSKCNQNISDNTLSFQGENGGKNLDFKSTVSVIFSDTQCKDGYMPL